MDKTDKCLFLQEEEEDKNGHLDKNKKSFD